LKQRHVSFTFTAQQHVAQEKAWWLDNRDHPAVFGEELEQALKIVAVLPGAGTVYPNPSVAGLRRVYLRRVASTSTTPTTTAGLSFERCGAHVESAVLSSNCNNISPDLMSTDFQVWRDSQGVRRDY
jgi:hypothetical protein